MSDVDEPQKSVKTERQSVMLSAEAGAGARNCDATFAGPNSLTQKCRGASLTCPYADFKWKTMNITALVWMQSSRLSLM